MGRGRVCRRRHFERNLCVRCVRYARSRIWCSGERSWVWVVSFCFSCFALSNWMVSSGGSLGLSPTSCLSHGRVAVEVAKSGNLAAGTVMGQRSLRGYRSGCCTCCPRSSGALSNSCYSLFQPVWRGGLGEARDARRSTVKAQTPCAGPSSQQWLSQSPSWRAERC